MTKDQLIKSRQYKDFLNSNIWFKMPASWCVRFNLTPTELLIFSYIRFATENGTYGKYTGSIKGLSVLCNVSLPTARNAVEKLEREGFIKKDIMQRDGKRWVCYEAYLTDNVIRNINARGQTVEEFLAVRREINRHPVLR
ncbi:MAG: hypothetical protein IKT42_04585 [Clostridia bacterium]|nr:hypothetical protein [Clostridia bacterium]